MASAPSNHDLLRVRQGIVAIAILTAASLAVFFLDIAMRATAEGERITVLAATAPGLRPGSAVWVAGRPMGRVLSVSFRAPGAGDESIVIRAVLDREAEPILRANARAEVQAPEIMAPVVVSIDPGSGSTPPWDYADTLRTAGRQLDPEAVMALADTLMVTARRLETQAAAARRRLETGSGSLQRLRRNPAVMRGIQDDLERFRQVMDEHLATSSLLRLASDTVVGPTAARIKRRLAAWEASPRRDAATRGLEQATSALRTLGERVRAISGHLEAGEGTAGRALQDRELLRQIKALRTGIRALTEELTYEPRRWLRVRVF